MDAQANIFVRWVKYLAWLNSGGFQPISYFEYLQLRGERA